MKFWIRTRRTFVTSSLILTKRSSACLPFRHKLSNVSNCTHWQSFCHTFFNRRSQASGALIGYGGDTGKYSSPDTSVLNSQQFRCVSKNCFVNLDSRTLYLRFSGGIIAVEIIFNTGTSGKNPCKKFG